MRRVRRKKLLRNQLHTVVSILVSLTLALCPISPALAAQKDNVAENTITTTTNAENTTNTENMNAQSSVTNTNEIENTELEETDTDPPIIISTPVVTTPDDEDEPEPVEKIDKETVYDGTEKVENEEVEEEEEPATPAGELYKETKEGYSVTVKYGEDAKIPEKSTLSVKPIAKDDEKPYADKLGDALDLKAGEEALFTAYLDISIISPKGEEVKPSAPVDVEIRFTEKALPNEVAPSSDEIQKTLEVVHFDDSGQAAKPEEQKAIDDGGDVGVTFTTESFSVFSITSISQQLSDWITNYLTMKVYSLFSITSNITSQSNIKPPVEGETEVLEAYKVSGSSLYWLDWTFNKQVDTGKYGSVDLFATKSGSINSKLSTSELTGDLRFLSMANADGFALVKDSGLRTQTFDEQPAEGQEVEISGRVPIGASAVITDVTDAHRDAYDKLLAAYDVTINDGVGGEFQPENGSPMEVSVSNPAIAKLFNDGGQADVKHVLADGSLEDVKSSWDADAERLVFDADGFSIYIIIDHEGNTIVTTPRVQFHFLDEEYTEGANGVYTAGPFNFPNKAEPSTSQWTQILTNGEDLEMITNPPNIIMDNGDGTTSEKFFYGWYVVDFESEDGIAYTDGQWTGSISYKWTDDPEKIVVENPISITTSGGSLSVGDTISWSINGISSSGVLDEEGIAHVYLAPIYENYYFVNFRMAALIDSQSALQNELITRKLAVLGADNSATVRIGDIVCQGANPTHQVFIGWQTEEMSQLPDVEDRYYATVDGDGEEIDNPEGSGGYYITLSENDFDDKAYDLYPFFAEARWLYFNAGRSGNGASYIPATYRLNHDEGSGTCYDTAFFNSHTSTRNGYDMKGWYAFANTDANSKITNLSTPEPVNVSYVDLQGAVQTVTFNMTAQELVHHNGSYSIITPANNANIATTTVGGVTYTLKSNGGIYYLNIGGTDYKLFGVTDNNLYFYRAMNDLTLCANWVPQTVNYTIVYWLENANDSKYSLMYYKTMQGVAGEQTAAAVVQPSDIAVRDDETYYPYEEYKLRFAHLSTDQDKSTAGNQSGIRQQEIAGDGSTVVNVYYDRNVYKLRFDLGFAAKTGNAGSETTYTTMTPAEAATYSGTVYGIINGTATALTKDINGNWIYANADAGDPYGIISGDYVPLTKTAIGTVQLYKPQYAYISTSADTENGLYGIDANGNYEELIGVPATTTTYTANYKYTQNATATSNLYGIVNSEYETLYRIQRQYTVDRFTNISKNDYYWNGSGFSNAIIYNENGTYYLTRSGWWFTGYTYSNEVIPYSMGNNTSYYYYLDGGAQYTDLRYTRTNDGETVIEANDVIDGSYYIDNNNGKVPVTAHSTTVWNYTLNGVDYTGTRYTRADNDGTTTYPETNSNIVEHGNVTCYHDVSGTYGAANAYIPVVEAGTEETYSYSYNGTTYDGTIYEMSAYEGDLYKQTVLEGTWRYFVSGTTGPNYSNASNWDTFLTADTRDLGTTNPFKPGEYTGTYEVSGIRYNNANYNGVVYYYDITAKYDQNILDLYPGSQLPKVNGNNTYIFVGWLSQRDSFYNARLNTSIKGFFETVSEDLILTGGTVPGWNVKNENADPDDYVDVTIDDNNTWTDEAGITQEFHCRYTSLSGAKKYLYRVYLADVDTGEYPSDPSAKFVITGGSGSNPNIQTPPTYYGYTLVENKVLDRNGNEMTPTANNYSEYPIPELTEAGVGNGMVMVFRLQPNDHVVDYKYGSGAETPGGTFGETVHYNYGKSLADANIYQEEAEAATPTGHEFLGWYTNPDGIGEPFDFNTTMPDGNIVLYAVYSPLWFVMHIDPNGAEIDHINHNDPNSFNRPAIPGERAADAGYNPSQSTYFWLAYDATIGEYNVTRNYVPISDEAASQYEGQIYYYMNHQYSANLDGDWGLNANARNALYLTDAEVHSYYAYYASYASQAGVTVLSEDVWRQYYVSPQKYRICSDRETYKFLGWYQVFNAGTADEYVDSMPYIFSTPVSGDITLRAMWRLDGGYKIQYHADYYMEDGTYINGTMPDWFDPRMGTLTYADGAATTIYKQPTDIMVNGEHTDEYVFRGFRLVSIHEDSNNHLNFTALEDGVYYQPGDDYTVFAANADTHGTIHLQAVYEELDSSYRRPYVTNLSLDANGGYLTNGAGTKLEGNRDLTIVSEWDGIGTVAATAFDPETEVSLDPDALIEFGDIQSNQAVHLYRYATNLTTVGGLGQTDLDPAGTNYFAHPQNFFLLGFDDQPAEGDYIATYAADGVISIKRNDNKTIYAIWEPMIYLNFENNTSNTVNFSLAPTQTGSLVLYVLNQVTGLYDRQEIDPSNLSLAPGETMHLALPYGEEQGLTISGTNQLGVGKRLIWNTSVTDDDTGITYTTKDGTDDETTLYDQTSYTHTHDGNSCVHDLASGSVDSSGTAQFSFDERLLFNSKGMTVTFDEDDIGYALVLDDNYTGGGAQEYDYAELSATDPRSQGLPSTSTRMGYQLLGWAYDKNATTPDYSATLPVDSPWAIADLYDFFHNNQSVEKEYINDGATLQATLYAVWDINNAASTVYVYKNVPEPGNQNTEFSFEYKMQGTYRASNYPSQNFNQTQAFTLAHGEYAVLVSSNRISNVAEIQTVITIYNADGTVKKDASDQDITYTVRWSGTSHQGGGFQDLNLSVTESELPYYDTSITRSAQSTNNFFIYVGNDTTGNVTQADTNAIHWTGTDAGGTVVFTNQRQTHDVVVNKVLHSNTTVAGTFAFSASYTVDGETITLPDAQVTSGTPNTTWLKDIPAGAVITITESNNGDYDTVISAQHASDEGPADDYSFTFTVNDDDTVTFDNTLKSYPIKFRLYNQYGEPLSGMFSMSSATSSLGNQLYADPAHDGIFYQNNHFWVGEYTLNENIIPTGYIGLTEPATVSITGDPDHPVTTNSDMIYISEDPNVSGGYIVTVYNIVPSVPIKLTKKLNDPLLDQRTFTFTVGYTYELLDPEGQVMLTINKSNTYPIQATHQGTTETILVPGGATVTASEVLTAELIQTYDVTHEIDDSGEIAGASWSDTIPITEQEHTVVFTNKRKTVQVTVQKEAPEFPQDESYHFDAILDKRATGDNKALANWEIAPGYTTNLAGYMVSTGGGAIGFTLNPNGQMVLTIPYGSCLRISEDEGNYKTSVTLDSTDPQIANSIALSATQTRQNHTITFTNTLLANIAPTDASQNSVPYQAALVLGAMLLACVAPAFKKGGSRRKGGKLWSR